MSANKKIKVTIISLVSLAFIILFSLLLFITDFRGKIANATITRQQLSLLESFDLITDTKARLTELLATKSHRAWLHLAKLHANNSADTAYQLAEYYRQHNAINSAQLWYQVAIRQQHIPARIALASRYFDQKKYADIKPLLLPIIDNTQALKILYKLALHKGDMLFIKTYKDKLASGANHKFYRELEQFSVFSANSVKVISEQNIASNLSCVIDVQLFATNLTGLRHGTQLISAFEQHKLAQTICLRKPKYIAADDVNCQHQPNEKITCNATAWVRQKSINTRYLGLIVEVGGANVDNGIMYIDQADNVDVLVHELSHLVGFVDEYPLPSKHQKCQQFQQAPFAHNLVVLSEYYQGERNILRAKILSQIPWRSFIKDSTPILSKHQKGWRLSTPKKYHDEIGVFTSASCDKQNAIQAFKPLAQRTKLQYFELVFPDTYIDIMLLAPRRYLMPSYHFNVSRDLVEKGDYSKAREVLEVTLFD